MKDKFFAGLENFWDPIAMAPGGEKYIVTAFRDNEPINAIVTILYPKGDTAEVQFLALVNPDYFTDGVIYSIFKELSMIVLRHGSNYKALNCDASFGEKARCFSWHLNEVVKEGGAK